VPVLGCALSARAACELRDQAGVDATTIASLLHGFERGATLAHGAVLLVDEAAMVGTRDLSALVEAIAVAEGKLVLVGDDRQLPEISAGGLFAELAEHCGARELREVRRQTEAWDRDALAALRSGDVERFARAYARHGRIVASPTAEASREQLVLDWLQARSGGERAIMLAHRRRDVADLNQRARRQLRALGRLGPDQLVTDAGAFAEGDRVVARRNDRRLGIVNGDVGRLALVDGPGLTVVLDDGRYVELPDRYARDGHLQHGYALTAHLAQGSTVDRAFVLGSDELYREWGYTALSRHRMEARFYVSASREFLNQAPEPLDAEGLVARTLAASRAQRAALDGIARDPRRQTLDRKLHESRERLDELDRKLSTLQQRRADLPWHRRAQRQELDRVAVSLEYRREKTVSEVDRLSEAVWAARPERVMPRFTRATDPLAGLGTRHERSRRRSLDRGIDLELER
jgi:ATP-dependent exoDNAse (exonuclease V) alpha subunit